MSAPDGLLEAFWSYERALAGDDLRALAALFADGPQTLRGDRDGLLVGHTTISAFRQARGGAPARTVVQVEVRTLDDDTALVVAVTAAASGGRGLQTQLWRRSAGAWAVVAAHVSAPPATFDRAVWRVVGDPLVPGSRGGRLRGETVAVKDLFAVEGHPVGGGVPALLEEATAAERSATAVQRLLDAGADVRGIARTDQLAYSLAGDNPHYGTPVNGAVPGALPGGSSSGSATAVAVGAATIGLATDTAGSVRVPASYQGLWGLRTTHGAVPTDGLLPLAPDLDAVGLLTRDPDLLSRATGALLAEAGDGSLDPLILVPAAPPRLPDRESAAFAGWATGRPTVALPDLAPVAEALRVHQARQAWQVHGRWVAAHPDALRGPVRDRFALASTVTREQDAAAQAVLAAARRQLDDLLGDRVLALPSTGSVAPRVWDPPEQVDRARGATLRLTCVAGTTGRPALSAPLLQVDGEPYGLSLVGPRASDLALIGLAAAQAG